MRVLVVEDERKTAAFIRKALQTEGFAVDVCPNGEEAWAAARATPFDAMVLDIMLPGRDGLSLLRQLRQNQNSTPVLLLSARGEVNERVEGLNAGADDYLPKPFVIAELVARVRALGRRGDRHRQQLYFHPPLQRLAGPGGCERQELWFRTEPRLVKPKTMKLPSKMTGAGPALQANAKTP